MTPNLWLLLAALAVSLAGGLWWRSRQGVVGRARERGTPWAGLGLPADRVILLQMSSEICSACRHTARVLTDLAAQDDGVIHRELDVAEHPELTAALNVLRTPTVVVIGPDGSEAARASGAMTPRQAREAVAVARGASATPGTDERQRAVVKGDR